jgi:alpha-amylase
MKKTEANRTVCLFFHIHQPFRLKTYRFFNIGTDRKYFDEANNKDILQRIALNCYLPANELLMSLIKKYGKDFKVTFGISGMAIEQLKKYAPGVLDSFRRLHETGNIEIVAEPYAYSLPLFTNPVEYKRQIEKHIKTIGCIFGCKPVTFMNANLLYSNQTAKSVHQFGFTTILTEGAKQALGWKSPDYVYASKANPEIRLLLRHYQLSDDISFRYSMQGWNQWPLTPEKYTSWLNALDPKEQVVNLFMDYGTFGEYQNNSTGIFPFMNAFVENAVGSGKWIFRTVSEVTDTTEPADLLDIPNYISWADQDRDLSAWLGNELQQEAVTTLYSAAETMEKCDDHELLRDWYRLQTCDHFYYMTTKYLKDGGMYHSFSPYSSPYEAFVNYMNVVSDFLIRVNEYAGKLALKNLLQREHDQYQLITI